MTPPFVIAKPQTVANHIHKKNRLSCNLLGLGGSLFFFRGIPTFFNKFSNFFLKNFLFLQKKSNTINENMPFRCLEYVTRIYEGIIPVKERYAEKVYKIPNPDFYVVYFGKKNLPPEQELRLSDAFYTKDSSKLELVVKVKNCTDPKLLPIFKTCDILKEYFC